jgi:hypothetical protein
MLQTRLLLKQKKIIYFYRYFIAGDKKQRTSDDDEKCFVNVFISRDTSLVSPNEALMCVVTVEVFNKQLCRWRGKQQVIK